MITDDIYKDKNNYFCKLCNYNTESRFNISHHKNTKKHIKNLNLKELNKVNLEKELAKKTEEISLLKN
jgi:hypothetical protein